MPTPLTSNEAAVIADRLFEAVEAYDEMVTTSNKPLWARPKQKTI